MKGIKIILAELRTPPMGGLQSATACCRLAITVDKCSDWLQQLPHEYSCWNYFISFQTWLDVKI